MSRCRLECYFCYFAAARRYYNKLVERNIDQHRSKDIDYSAELHKGLSNSVNHPAEDNKLAADNKDLLAADNMEPAADTAERNIVVAPDKAFADLGNNFVGQNFADYFSELKLSFR